jgi:hypothetical protein
MSEAAPHDQLLRKDVRAGPSGIPEDGTERLSREKTANKRSAPPCISTRVFVKEHGAVLKRVFSAPRRGCSKKYGITYDCFGNIPLILY